MYKKLKSEKGFSSFSYAIMFVLCFVTVVSLTVSALEYFLPLSKYNNMAETCRRTLMQMEKNGGLSLANENNLRTTLVSQGLTIVSITADRNVKYGEDVNLKVEATYTYSKLKYLARESVTERFVYDKGLMQRKITN